MSLVIAMTLVLLGREKSLFCSCVHTLQKLEDNCTTVRKPTIETSLVIAMTVVLFEGELSVLQLRRHTPDT